MLFYVYFLFSSYCCLVYWHRNHFTSFSDLLSLIPTIYFLLYYYYRKLLSVFSLTTNSKLFSLLGNIIESIQRFCLLQHILLCIVSVCLNVSSLSVTLMHPAKATGVDKMPFGGDTRVVASNTKLDRGTGPPINGRLGVKTPVNKFALQIVTKLLQTAEWSL